MECTTNEITFSSRFSKYMLKVNRSRFQSCTISIILNRKEINRSRSNQLKDGNFWILVKWWNIWMFHSFSWDIHALKSLKYIVKERKVRNRGEQKGKGERNGVEWVGRTEQREGGREGGRGGRGNRLCLSPGPIFSRSPSEFLGWICLGWKLTQDRLTGEKKKQILICAHRCHDRTGPRGVARASSFYIFRQRNNTIVRKWQDKET